MYICNWNKIKIEMSLEEIINYMLNTNEIEIQLEIVA